MIVPAPLIALQPSRLLCFRQKQSKKAQIYAIFKWVFRSRCKWPAAEVA